MTAITTDSYHKGECYDGDEIHDDLGLVKNESKSVEEREAA